MKLSTRKEIQSWTNLDDFMHSDLGRGQTNIAVVFCAPEGFTECYPWKTGDNCLYLGDVLGMGGHGVFVGPDGLVRWGYHTDSFWVPPGVIEDIKDELERAYMPDYPPDEEQESTQVTTYDSGDGYSTILHDGKK